MYMNKLNELYRDMLFLLFGIKPKNTGWTSFSQLACPINDYGVINCRELSLCTNDV